MRTLDDFAFVKDAGFDELYERIMRALSLYEKDLLPYFCASCRLALERALKDCYLIAGFEESKIPQAPAKRIANLGVYLPGELYPLVIKESFTDLNQLTNKYHHDEDYPAKESWGKDAENCLRLMVTCFRYLVEFKKSFPEYIAHNGMIDYELRMVERLESRSDLPAFHSIEYTMPEDFDYDCLSMMNQEKQYCDSLERDLSKLYCDLKEKTLDTYIRRVISFPYDLTKDLDEETSDALFFMVNNRDFFSRLVAVRHVNSYDSVIHPILFDPSWNLDEMMNDTRYSGGPISLKKICWGLRGVNLYAVKKVIDKLDAHEFLREKVKKDFETQDETTIISGLNSLSKACDISALRDLANFSQFLRVRDRGLLLNTQDLLFRELSADDLQHDNCRSLIIEREKRIKEVIKQVLAELFDASNGSVWNTLYPFEKKYISDIIRVYKESPFLKTIKSEISLTDRQKYIISLRELLEDSTFHFLKVIDEDEDYVFDREYYDDIIEEATHYGFLNQNAVEFFGQSYSFYNSCRILQDCGVQNVWEYINECGTLACNKGILKKNDPGYALKAASLSACFALEKDTQHRFDEALKTYNIMERDGAFNSENDACSSIMCEYWYPLMTAVQYIVCNNPGYVTRLPQPWGNVCSDEGTHRRERATLKDIFAFVRKMSPYGLRHLIIDFGVSPKYEDEFIRAIQQNDYESFKGLYHNDVIAQSDTLSIVINGIIESINAPLEQLRNMSLYDLSPTENYFSNYFVIEGAPRSTAEQYHFLTSDLSSKFVQRFFPSVEREGMKHFISQVAFSLGVVLSLYDVIDESEADALDSVLNNPRHEGIDKLSHGAYYMLSGRWPSNTRNPLSDEEKREFIAYHNSNTLDKHKNTLDRNVSQTVESKSFHYALQDGLFDGVVDTNNQYIPGLKRELRDHDLFERLFNFILQLGGITSSEEAGALLRSFTGYPVENASQRAKWETDYHILYYLVKYMFTPKKSYVSMSQCIDIYYPSDDEKRKAEKSPSSYAERISGDDAPYIIETLSRLSSVFPRPETPIAD